MTEVQKLMDKIEEDWNELVHSDEYRNWRERFEQEPAERHVIDGLSGLAEKVQDFPESQVQERLLNGLNHLEDWLANLG